MKKRFLAVTLVGAMAATALAGCGSDNKTTDNTSAQKKAESGDKKKGSVYYLNFKPEAEDAWQALAKAYTEETGIEVKVVTAASGQYETTLEAEMGKEEAPTLFQVNGPVGLANWADKCADLSETDVYKNLTSEDYGLKKDDKVLGIAYVIESYGIITNKKLLQEAGHSVDEINSFDTLKSVVEDITAKKAAGEVKFSAFTSAGMDGSSDWRFKTHLANLPIYFEYQEDGIDSTDAIKGTYLDNYRQIWDLYINNATAEGKDLSAKTGTDAENEFLNGEAVFFQNGSWEYTALSAKIADDDMTMIPIYVGAGDEAKQGLCTGTENFWCVNQDASDDDVAATLDFMNWCVTSEKGTKAMAEDMGFTIPFKNAVESKNVFVKQDVANTEAGLKPVSWNFTTMPSEEWKNGVGTALTAYAADPSDANWDAVKTAFVDGWAKEYKLANADA